MRRTLLISAGLAVALWALSGAGCKKAEKSTQGDPHSADGALERLREQGRLFRDAYVRKDFQYLHDWGYYFNGVLEAFYLKLDDAQKIRLRGTLDELTRASSQLDSATGRGHEGATEDVVQRIETLLQDLERQYRGSKSGLPGGGQEPALKDLAFQDTNAKPSPACFDKTQRGF